MKTSTPILISAMRILARDIQTDDGVANAAISEAADRLQELHDTGILYAHRKAAFDEMERGVTGLQRMCDNAKVGLKKSQKYISELTSNALLWHTAIQKTLSENAELADGEDCTLIHLKKALEASRSPWAKLDYNNPETFPEENHPCLVAWDCHPEHPARHAMYQFNDVGDDMRLWREAISGDIMDWDGTEENPTHWMYAPELRP